MQLADLWQTIQENSARPSKQAAADQARAQAWASKDGVGVFKRVQYLYSQIAVPRRPHGSVGTFTKHTQHFKDSLILFALSDSL